MAKRPDPPPPPAPFNPGDAVSASQIELFENCQIKWYFSYKLGMREPDTEATLLGGEVHEAMELWQLHGTFPDRNTRAGRLAAALIPISPAPGTHQVEEHFYYVTPLGNLLHGYVDLVERTPLGAIVRDYKTSSNFEYVKKLPTNTQALIYAAAYRAVMLEWLYVHTKGKPGTPPATRPVVWKPPGDVTQLDAFKKLDRKVSELVRSRSLPLAQLTGNRDFCRAFGKVCHVKPICPLHTKGNTTMTTTAPKSFAALRAQLAAKKSGAEPATSPAVATAPAMTEDQQLEANQKATLAAKAAEAARQIAASVGTTVKPEPVYQPAPTTPAALPSTELPQPEPKAKRTRKPAEPATAAVVTPAPAAVSAPVSAPATSHTYATLLIDTIPTRIGTSGVIVFMAELFAAAHDKVRAAHGVAHFSAGEFAARGTFIEAVGEELAKVLAQDTTIFVIASTAHDEWRLVAAAVEAQFPMVLRGIR